MRLTLPITAAIFCLICIFCGVPGTEAQEDSEVPAGVEKVVLPCGDSPGPCPGACCSECKVRVECLCHNDDKHNVGFQFKLLVNNSTNSYAAEFGPNARTEYPGDPCITKIKDWTKLDANGPWTHQKKIGMNDCGTNWMIHNPSTSSKYEKSVIQFWNIVRVFQQIKTKTSDIITDELNVTVTCNCTVEGNLTYIPTMVKTKMTSEVGTSSSNINLNVKCGEERCCYPNEKPDNENGCCKKDPKECCLKENICVSSNWGDLVKPIMPDGTFLEIFPLNCRAETDGESVPRHQNLIQEGCGNQLFGIGKDNDEEEDDDDDDDSGEFCFQAFRFPNSNNKIKIHCQIVICKKDSPNSLCTEKRNVCKAAKLHYSNNPSVKRESQRRKRSVNMGSYVAIQEVMVGPIAITDAPNMSYAAKVVSPRHKFAGVRRRLNGMMRKLRKLRG